MLSVSGRAILKVRKPDGEDTRACVDMINVLGQQAW